MCRREIEMQRCRAVQSLEMPWRSREIETSESPYAIGCRRTARECGQAMRAQLEFQPLRKRPAAFPVGGGAIRRGHDRYLHWSKEHLRPEYFAMRGDEGATPSCFRFAETGLAKR